MVVHVLSHREWPSQDFPTRGGGEKRGSEATDRGQSVGGGVLSSSHGTEIMKILV